MADDDGNGKITPNELETILGDKVCAAAGRQLAYFQTVLSGPASHSSLFPSLFSIACAQSIMGDARIQLGDTPEGDLTAAIMRRLDTSGDGSLDFDEFCVALADVISLDESHKPTILSTSTESVLADALVFCRCLSYFAELSVVSLFLAHVLAQNLAGGDAGFAEGSNF